MLEIARVMPSFGGFYYNDEGEIEVALTNTADLEHAGEDVV